MRKLHVYCQEFCLVGRGCHLSAFHHTCNWIHVVMVSFIAIQKKISIECQVRYLDPRPLRFIEVSYEGPAVEIVPTLHRRDT